MNSMAREISRSIVTSGEIAEIAKNKLPKGVSFDHSAPFGFACFESGMIGVLRGIADEDMEYGAGNIPETSEMKRWLKVRDEKSESLRQNFDEDANSLFDEFEEAFHNSAMAEEGENYIQGVIRGYCYLKNQMEYRGGGN